MRIATLTITGFALTAMLAPAQIPNPSFEAETDGIMPDGVSTGISPHRGLPDHWEWRRQDSLDGHGDRGPQAWVTDGEWCPRMFVMAHDEVVARDFIEWSQEVDLTGIDAIVADASLGPHDLTRSYVAVDGHERWTADAPGESLDITVPVGDLAGIRTLALAVVVVAGGTPWYADGRTSWDHLRAEPGVPAGARTLSGVKALFGGK
jgi:hypothetical protein